MLALGLSIYSNILSVDYLLVKNLLYLLTIYWSCRNDFPLLVIISQAYVLSLFKIIYFCSGNRSTTCVTLLENLLLRDKNNYLQFILICLIRNFFSLSSFGEPSQNLFHPNYIDSFLETYT